jgi:hypothetical protein
MGFLRLALTVMLAVLSGIALTAFTPLGDRLQHSALGHTLSATFYGVPKPCVDIYAGRDLPVSLGGPLTCCPTETLGTPTCLQSTL